jgi:cytochrome c551/c552
MGWGRFQTTGLASVVLSAFVFAAPDDRPQTQLAAKIRAGSVGTWGRVIMPRQGRVTEADAQLLAEWVLSQPSPP